MIKVLDKSLVPPGGWRFRVSEGYEVVAPTFGELAKRVAAYREANGIPHDPASWEAELCGSIPQACGEPPPPPPEGRVVGLSDLNQFANTMMEWIKKGGGTVPQEEAERRAEICSTCPENLHLRGCPGCFTLINIVTKMLGKSTSKDRELQSCNVCGCALRAKVHVPAEVMHATPQPRKPWPGHCWMKEEPTR